MGGITALGESWADIEKRLRAKKNVVRHIDGWENFVDLHSRLGARIDHFEIPAHYPRRMRNMGRVAILSVRASELALADAGLLNDPRITDGRMGVAYGSSFGSADPLPAFGKL